MAVAEEIIIYTDGACAGNPGPGGWGAVLQSAHHQKKIAGFEADTTNNRMELMAAIQALESLKSPSVVRLYTDSQYVKRGMTEWLQGWKAMGWRTRSKSSVKNVDLWQRLDAACQRHQVEWCWVQGHAGCAGNELADTLARNAIVDGLQ